MLIFRASKPGVWAPAQGPSAPPPRPHLRLVHCIGSSINHHPAPQHPYPYPHMVLQCTGVQKYFKLHMLFLQMDLCISSIY